MRNLTMLTLLLGLARQAHADDPPSDPPAPDAPIQSEPPVTAPSPPPAAPSPPTTPTATPPTSSAAPSPPATPTATPPTSSAAPSPHPSSDAFEVAAVGRAPRRPRGTPTLALELAGAGAYNADPYIQHEGWNLKTGTGMGVRLEGQLVGITLGYELTRMTNAQACAGSECFTGSFGSTVVQAIDVGFRYRFVVGPLRPFFAGSLGAVAVNSGTWTMATNRSVYGGLGRATLGVELPLPILDRFYAVGQVGYRFIITENPLHDDAADKAAQGFLGADVPAGAFAEDAHQVAVTVGIGVEL